MTQYQKKFAHKQLVLGGSHLYRQIRNDLRLRLVEF